MKGHIQKVKPRRETLYRTRDLRPWIHLRGGNRNPSDTPDLRPLSQVKLNTQSNHLNQPKTFIVKLICLICCMFPQNNQIFGFYVFKMEGLS